MRKFGLIGYPLSHSFSKQYFSQKFENEDIKDTSYELYPIKSIDEFPELIDSEAELTGLNVTIPYKETVIPFLDSLGEQASRIGAVNTIVSQNGKLIGHNTDYLGFKKSMELWVGVNPLPKSALVLGTGGASKAVKAVLNDLDIKFQFVSRTPKGQEISYEDVSNNPEILSKNKLIINTTPLGMAPDSDSLPPLPYEYLTSEHYLFDLVYNPLITAFMQKGIDKKSWVKNGLEMLHIQAEESWKIWNA